MATRQYIGARYVPKFYENSDGTAEWRSGVIYEPLTIVTWNGNSYTSKKVVPANIGNPSANPAYWVATGVFNEQLEDVQERIAEIENSMSTDVNKDAFSGHILFIGDSYITALTPSYADHVGTALGKVRGESYFVNAQGGTGFAAYAETPRNNFTTLLNSAVVTDENLITAIFVEGGSNDIYTANVDNIETGITQFCEAARTRFPNARIFIGMCDGWIDAGFTETRRDVLYRYYQRGSALNGAFFLGATGNGLKIDRTNMLQSDLKHPSAAGMRDIAYRTMLGITGNGMVTHYLNNQQYYIKGDGDTVEAWFYNNYNQNYEGNERFEITCTGTNPINLDMPNGELTIVEDLIVDDIAVMLVSGNNYYLMRAKAHFTHTGMTIYPLDMNDDHTNFRTISAVRQVSIRAGVRMKRALHTVG